MADKLPKSNSGLIKSVSGTDLGSDQQKHYDGDGDSEIVRERTILEREVIARHDAAEELIAGLDTDPTKVYIPSMLSDALFCGHLVTDMDSIAGAIGAAELYGGKACRASEVNSETAFCLERWGVAKPPPVEEMLEEFSDAGVCLVDHQQTSQLNPAIPLGRIVGVIDHHALQSETIVTAAPIFIDIRPWGSMSTIVAHGFLTAGRKPSQPVAGMLLCAIISDTLNLQGPTTTQWDKMMVAILAIIAGVDDVNLLSSQQFKAKSRELAGLSATQLCSGDCKVFKLAGPGGRVVQVGFAVVETTDDGVILDRKSELLPELVASKAERRLDFLFLAVVNIVAMRSHLLLCGAPEVALARHAFEALPGVGPGMASAGVMDLGSRVSRKKEFVPPLTLCMPSFAGSLDSAAYERTPSLADLAALTAPEADLGPKYVDPADPQGKVLRKRTRSGEEPQSPAHASPPAAKRAAAVAAKAAAGSDEDDDGFIITG